MVGVQSLDLQWQGSLSFQSAGLDYDWLSMNCQEILCCVSVTLGCFTIGLDLFSLTLCLGCRSNTPGICPFFQCPELPLGCGGILELILCDDLDSRT